jgi:hypothetical protein
VLQPIIALSARSDGVPSRFGDELASGGHGPADLAAGEVLSVPSGVLFHPVAVPALGVAVAQAGPSPGFVRDVVLEIAVGGGAPAAGAGAGRVPDLGEVPERDAGIMTVGLVPVIAVPGGDRLDLEEQVALAGEAGGEPPGAVAAGRAGRPAGVKVNRGLPGGSGPPGLPGLPGWAGRRGPLAGAGRAQPWPMAWPWLSVTVTHQVERGLRAAAWARSRARSGSTGPISPVSPGLATSGSACRCVGNGNSLSCIPPKVRTISGQLCNSYHARRNARLFHLASPISVWASERGCSSSVRSVAGERRAAGCSA